MIVKISINLPKSPGRDEGRKKINGWYSPRPSQHARKIRQVPAFNQLHRSKVIKWSWADPRFTSNPPCEGTSWLRKWSLAESCILLSIRRWIGEVGSYRGMRVIPEAKPARWISPKGLVEFVI